MMAALGSAIGICSLAEAAVETIWSHDYGAGKVRKLQAGMEIAADALAPGGKALRLDHAPRYQYFPAVRPKDLVLAGPVSLTVTAPVPFPRRTFQRF